MLDPLGLRPGHGRDAFSESTFAGYPGSNFYEGYAGLQNLNGGGRTLSHDSPRQISVSGQLLDSSNNDYACVRYGACTSGASSDLDTALAVASVGPVAGEIIDGYDCVFGGSAWSCAAVFVPFVGGRAVREGASWFTGLFRSSDEIAEVVPGSLSADILRRVDANLTGSGETVLGHYADDYIGIAQQRGASYFDIGDAWDGLTDAQRWAANRRFLDAVIASGDRITTATARGDIRYPSALADEIQYLIANGYQWVDDVTLVPG